MKQFALRCFPRKKEYFFLTFYFQWSMIYELLNDMTYLIIGREISTLILFNKIVLIIFLAIAGLHFLKSFNSAYIITIIVGWLSLLVGSCILVPEILFLVPKFGYYTISQVIITAMFFSEVKDFTKLEHAFEPYIILSIFYSIIHTIVFNKTGNYSMQYSYATLVPTLLSMLLFFEKKRFLYLVIFLTNVMVNLNCGSRGSLLCYGIAIVIYMCVFTNVRRRMLYIVTGTILLGALFLNLQNIAAHLEKIFPGSRTIELFAKGKLFYMSGREKYYTFILEEIKDAPFKMRGIYSDRLSLGNFFGRTSKNDIFGTYAHNIVLEILFQFGVWGLFILLSLGIVFIIGWKNTDLKKNRAFKNFFIVIVSYAVGQLMFSSSYLNAPSFGAVAGLVIAMFLNKDKKVAKQEKVEESK